MSLLQFSINVLEITSPSLDNRSGIWQLLMQGGFTIYIVFALLMLTIFIFFERYIYIQEQTVVDKKLLPDIKTALLKGDIEAASVATQKDNSATARIMKTGLSRIGKPIDVIESGMRQSQVVEEFKINKRMRLLHLTGRFALLLGILVTILKLVLYLLSLSGTPQYELTLLLGNMYPIFIPAFSGMCVALLSGFLHYILSCKISRAQARFLTASQSLITLLQEPSKM